MDNEKIGKFIAKKRKEKNLTQQMLAEKLNMTDRSVSKWETGSGMPDASIITDLCKILEITINDLFSGEVVDMKNNEKKLEENLLAVVKEKEEKDKQLLALEWVIGFTSSITFMAFIFLASFLEMPNILKGVLIIFGIIIFAVGMFSALRIEQTAGYYECAKCHNKYIPTYKSVFLSMHIGRTRYMKCPKCKEKSWNKKVITK